MRILIVYPALPFPPDGGGRIVDFNLLRAMSSIGHELTALALVDKATDPAAIERARAALTPFCELHPLRVDLRPGAWRRVENTFSRTPYTMAKYRSDAVASELHRTLQEAPWDIVLLDGLHLAFLADSVPDGTRSLLLEHNVQASILERVLLTRRNPFFRLLLWHEWRRLRRYEASACGRVDLCCTLSDVDAATLRQMNPALQPAVLPPPLDVDSYPELRPQTAPPVVTFVGGYDWLPNADAAEWFCERVFPRVVDAEPSAELQLVGRGPTARIRRHAASEPRIRVTGRVDDLLPLLQRTAVFIAPLRAGSGIRIKILEAMAWRLPVVSTSVGCEGIGAAEGEGLLVADTEEAFAGRVVKLLLDPQRRLRVGEAGRQWVARQHGLAAVVHRLEQLLTKNARPAVQNPAVDRVVGSGVLT